MSTLTDELTPRQIEVLTMIGRGDMYEEIAGSIGITVAGVKKCMVTVKKRLGADDRFDAVRKAGIVITARR